MKHFRDEMDDAAYTARFNALKARIYSIPPNKLEDIRKISEAAYRVLTDLRSIGADKSEEDKKLND
jgi:hypothetical protein